MAPDLLDRPEPLIRLSTPRSPTASATGEPVGWLIGIARRSADSHLAARSPVADELPARPGWTALALMWVAALALMLAPAIDLFDDAACAPRSARRVVADLVSANATPADSLFAGDRDPLEGRAPVRAGE